MTLETFCISKLEYVTGEVVEELKIGEYDFVIVKRKDGSTTAIEKSAIWSRHPL